MLASVNLDNEARFFAGEIHNMLADWHLAAKLQPAYLPVAKKRPEQWLSVTWRTK
jgi:hypothetical protein